MRITSRVTIAGLALALILGGCGLPPAPAPGAAAERPPLASYDAPLRSGASAVQAQDAQEAIKQIIERGNAEQVRAIAARDPSAMADTAARDYYRLLVETNQSLLAGGVVRIELLDLEWGPVTVDGTTATATTYETWRTTFDDGTTEQSRDLNVYTLALDNGTWKITADDHPDAGAQPGAPSSQTPAPRSPAPQVPVPTAPAGASESRNWSGYAATGGTFTAVTGSWMVPQTEASGAAGASAAWVGIGGVRSRDLIQAGTQVTASGTGRARYSAWIETLPQASRNVPLTVRPGDSVTVSIADQGADTWLVTLSNDSTGQRYDETVQYASSRSSAEWVQEAPSAGRGTVPVDDFGTVTFTNGSTVKDGKTIDLARAGARPITMIGADGQPLAVPSTIGTDAPSFSVVRTDVPVPAPQDLSRRPGRSRRGA
jgi:hypothetical protein